MGGVQPDLPFKELKNITQKTEAEKAAILFHLSRNSKNRLVELVKMQRLSVTKLINELINDYIHKFKQEEKPLKKKTGRGNIDWIQIEKVKELMRKHDPEGVRLQDIANYVGCSNARARGLIDILSDTHTQKDFLVSEDWEVKPIRYYIFLDAEMN